MNNKSYQEHNKILSNTAKHLNTQEYPRLMVLFGDNEALIVKAVEQLKQSWTKTAREFNLYHHVSYTYDDLMLIWDQPSFFEQSSMSCLYNIEKQKNFWQILEKQPSEKNTQNPTLLVVKTSTNLLSNLNKQLVRLKATFIPCFSPKQFEIPSVVKDMCSHYHLTLDSSALRTLQDHLGNNLDHLRNELNKLSLIFNDKKGPLSARDISQHLGFLREDHAFAIYDLILEDKPREAHLMILSLLQRGHHALMLLGVLSKFCSNALQIAYSLKDNHQPANPSKVIKLPPFVIKKYHSYLDKKKISHLKKALLECQRADLQLKTSSKLSHEIILCEILSYL